MRYLSACVTIFMAGLCAGLLLRESPAAAEASEAVGVNVTTACGDVNSDGRTDISDAIHLLGWLFLGGPAPMCRTGPLPATGQTQCFDAEGQPVVCGDIRWPGQDGSHQSGCPLAGRFEVDDMGTPDDVTDDTVTDHCTGLMWQSDILTPPPEYDPEGDTDVTWQQALQLCDRLVLTTDGTWMVQLPSENEAQFLNRVQIQQQKVIKYEDWRLPNVRELESLLRYDMNPQIDAAFFPGVPVPDIDEWLWSSTSYFDPTRAWGVRITAVTEIPFKPPISWETKTTDKLLVRAVRTIR